MRGEDGPNREDGERQQDKYEDGTVKKNVCVKKGSMKGKKCEDVDQLPASAAHPFAGSFGRRTLGSSAFNCFLLFYPKTELYIGFLHTKSTGKRPL